MNELYDYEQYQAAVKRALEMKEEKRRAEEAEQKRRLEEEVAEYQAVMDTMYNEHPEWFAHIQPWLNSVQINGIWLGMLTPPGADPGLGVFLGRNNDSPPKFVSPKYYVVIYDYDGDIINRARELYHDNAYDALAYIASKPSSMEEAVKLMGYAKQKAKMSHCPLLNRTCMGHDCSWWTKFEQCAIPLIGEGQWQ